jgi:hypothetical protein
MSWRASAWVKTLTTHGDGTRLTAREKLLLFVLADYHNDERDCAWAGLTTLATNCLTSRRHVVTLISQLESKGTIRIERRKGGSNFYFFVGLTREATSSVRKARTSTAREATSLVTREVATAPTREVATAPEPPLNRQEPKTPLPPTAVGGEIKYVERYGEVIEIRMGRRHRLPDMSSMTGARASDVARFLVAAGFSAHVLETN